VNTAIWLAVVALSAEAVFFGNGTALVAGLTLSVIGIYLEWRKNNVL
jgi:hypothetical protein